MTDPERLIVSGADEFERDLLRCAATDRAPATLGSAALSAAASALALGAAPASAVASLSAEAAAKTLPAAAQGTATITLAHAKGAGIVAVLKWLTAGVVAGTIVSAAATNVLDLGAREAPTPAPLVAPQPAAPAAEIQPAKAGVARVPPPATAAATPAPNPPTPSSKHPSVRAPANEQPALPLAVSAPVGSDTLEQELAVLANVRRSLGMGDGPGALRTLAHYQASFPNGRLSQEALVLRIEAQAAVGNLDAARALARSFLANNPRSPHARRVRSVTRLE